MKSSVNSQKYGQTLVEFALVLPIFIFIIVFIFDFGRAVYYINALHNAAREGARYGAVHSISPSQGVVTADVSGIKARVKFYAVGLGLTDANITYANIDPAYYETAGNVTNPTIRVEVKYNFYPVTPFLSLILQCGCSYITLTGEAVMRTEWMPIPLPSP
jgi:Flp pilus assembly protein TadG